MLRRGVGLPNGHGGEDEDILKRVADVVVENVELIFFFAMLFFFRIFASSN